MSQQTPAKKSEINWNLIAKLLVVGLIIVFFIQLKNMPQMTWSFLIFSFTWPTWLVLLVTFLLGAFFGRDVWTWILSKFRKPSA